MVSIIKNARIVSDGKLLENQWIAVKDGMIEALLPASSPIPGDAQIIDLKGNYLSPGWIDLHCHGAGGYEFIDGTREAILSACNLHAAHGTRILYPTVSATDIPTIEKFLIALDACHQDADLIIPGAHLEGPYLAPEMCGGQDPQYITAPIEKDYTALIKRFGDLIVRWDYAPERDDGTFQKALNDHGIVSSIAHSTAEYEDVQRVLALGCRLITHLYSCTSTVTRHQGFRHLGIIESSYLLDDIYVEAIADGCHLPAELLRLIVKIKGTEKVCLITDAIRHAGLTEITGQAGGTDSVPYIIEDGVAKLADRSAFAGSIATTDVLLRRTCKAGIPMPQVIRMMTKTPAEVMGLQEYGSIAPGYRACFTVFDENLDVQPNIPGM